MANNNYPQITSVTSESLQAQIRNLLPSQEGFGTDLMAQNVIVPVIDLTSAAEGSSVGTSLQQAIAFGSQTAFRARNSTATVVNNSGFFRILGNVTLFSAGTSVSGIFNMSDGLSTKQLFEFSLNGPTDVGISNIFDFIVFLRAGDSLSAVSNSVNSYLVGSARQVADVNGILVNPVGFTPQ